MGVPKRKQSNSRTGMRRSHHALTAKQLQACPKCGTVFDPEASVKARRPKAVAAERAAPVPAPVVAAEEEEVEVAEGEEAATEEAEDEAVMEDTSELGEDQEDVAEVIENVDEEDDR